MAKQLSILAFLLVAAVVYGSPEYETHDWGLSEEEQYPYSDAVEAFLAGRGTQDLGDITVGELRDLAGTLSVIAQEEDYVRRARNASRVMPGSGHFMIGENGIGAAYLTGSILVTAGTVIGAYVMLPKEVQFDELDYINDSFRDIGQAWRGQSIESLWPAFGILLSGGLVQAVLGELASDDAARRAREQIDSGAKQFDPKPFIYPDARGRLILGARIGF